MAVLAAVAVLTAGVVLAAEVVSATEVVLAAVVVEQQRNLMSDRFSVAKHLIDSTHMFHWYH